MSSVKPAVDRKRHRMYYSSMKTTPKRPRTVVIQARVTAEERAAIAKAAERDKRSVSSWAQIQLVAAASK
jgi:uncharacterized protein (DUF1778 family)